MVGLVALGENSEEGLTMNNEEQFVEFDKYCKSCQYEKLEENKSPCDECMEHPVNPNSCKPYCYMPRA